MAKQMRGHRNLETWPNSKWVEGGLIFESLMISLEILCSFHLAKFMSNQAIASDYVFFTYLCYPVESKWIHLLDNHYFLCFSPTISLFSLHQKWHTLENTSPQWSIWDSISSPTSSHFPLLYIVKCKVFQGKTHI